MMRDAWRNGNDGTNGAWAPDSLDCWFAGMLGRIGRVKGAGSTGIAELDSCLLSCGQTTIEVETCQ